ncbi:MAG: hypothetical protein ABIU05_27015 [Nitrospirales bacterium]
MHTTQDLTRHAHRRLISFLQDTGNVISPDHRIALRTLCEAFFAMGKGEIEGRWAMGLPTGAGKTSAAIKCMATLHHMGNREMSVVVSAGRIKALWDMKHGMIAAGVPEHKIGLMYVDGRNAKDEKGNPLPGYLPPIESTGDDTKQFLLISHQRTAKKDCLDEFRTYQGKPRSVVIYDESLLVSDVKHFNVHDLCQALAGCAAKFQLDVCSKPELATITTWLQEQHRAVSAAYAGYDIEGKNELPSTPLTMEEHVTYQEQFKAEYAEILKEFVEVAHLPLRLLRGLNTAAITYQITLPPELKNILVLDASYAIRMIENEGITLRNAEELHSCRRLGVKFDQIKSFENVTIKRMVQHGGRNSMANKKSKGKMKHVLLDAVKVIADIPKEEKVLVFVYKDRDHVNLGKYLQTCLEEAGLYNPNRIFIDTWGNETSSNDFRECKHVLLIGSLHRDSTELHAKYLGEQDNLWLELTEEKIQAICLSERAHKAYQAFSRGACRVMGDGGKALPMTGYVIEVEAALETELNKEMPGVKWVRWESVHTSKAAHGSLQKSIQNRIENGLDNLTVDSITCRVFKDSVMGGDTITPTTWKRALKQALKQKHQWTQLAHRLSHVA